jgi:RNA-directed DNA polymerase
VREIWLKRRGSPVAALIYDLNPVIRGWANYFRIAVVSGTFAKLDAWMFSRAYRYAKFRHPKKSWAWRRRRYWGQLHSQRDDRWVFGDPQTGTYLLKFGWFPVRRHVLVRGTASPDDPHLRAYWRQRAATQAAGHTARTQRLARRQHQVCPVCNETLFNGEHEHLLDHHRRGHVVGASTDPTYRTSRAR